MTGSERSARRYLAVGASATVSILGIYSFIPVAFQPGDFLLRVLFGLIALSFGVILFCTLVVLTGSNRKLLRNVVASCCVLVPVGWLVGCFDVGIISSLELLSVLLFVVVPLFQWLVFESAWIRNEA